jgi:MFS transporter, DHA2 family, multidrug resistance protein
MRNRIVKSVASLHHEHASYKWWILINIMIGTFMIVLNSTIVNTALPKIMTSFGISVDEAQWIVTAYMLALAVMLPTSGWLADRFGYKRIYSAGLVIFTFFSFMCGISWDQKSLIFMRILQGIGGGLIQPIGMAIVMREFPPEKRGLAMGFWSVASAASVSLGPLMGGMLSDNFDWHLIFTINVPVGILCLFATWIIQREYRTQQKHAFDLAGFISMSIFLSFMLIALASGNAKWNSGGWTSDFMMICYFMSIAGFAVFLVVEMNTEHPLVKLKLLGTYNFGLTNLVMFVFGVGMFGSTFLLPLYLQNSLGYTALQSGMVLLPVGILQAISGTIAGYFSDKINPKIPIITGVLLFGYSFYLNAQLSVFSGHPQIMTPMYLRGIAMGILFSPLSTLVLQGISRNDMAQASGITNVIRQVGGSFGVAILQALLTQRVAFHTDISGSAIPHSSPTFSKAMTMVQYHAVMNAGSSLKEAASQSSLIFSSYFGKQMFVWGIDDAFFFSCVCTLVCILPIIILKNKKRDS